MSGLRFCMVTTFYPPYNFGGDGIGIQRLSQALTRRGHKVTVLQDLDTFNVLNKDIKLKDEYHTDGVELVRLHNPLKRLAATLTHQVGRPTVNRNAIKTFFDERQFDVINFHNISQIGGPGILRYGTGLKLYMAHEHWLVCPTHVLWRHRREVCTGRQCARCAFHYWRLPQIWRYTGFLERELKHVDTFIAMSEFSKKKHHEFGFKREMKVVNYFLPDRQDRPSTSSKPDGESPHNRSYFLFVGRLEKIKGLDDVIPVFRDFSEADLLIAGDGEYATELKSLAAGISSVKFLGRLTPEVLEQYYRHALALIVPSVCFETFGIIIIEAFRQGTPVLARRIGPFPEIIERGGGGLLFDGPQDLLPQLRRFRNDPAFRSRIAKAGYESFNTHWSESAVIPRYLEVIRQTAITKGRMDIKRALDE